MNPQVAQRGMGRCWLTGVALLLTLAWALEAGAQDLVVDGGSTKNVPPALLYTNEYIGQTTTGTLNQAGYTNEVAYLYLGQNTGSSGTYNLSGGTLQLDGSEYIGNAGSGSFTQSGGAHYVGDWLYLGYYPGASGTYNLSGGILSAGYEYIGGSGSGAFTQSGGTNSVQGTLSLGYYPGGSGTYNLSGGELEVNNTENIGDSGSGSFTQSGGAHVAADLILGANAGASGSYTLNGGSNTVGNNLSIGSASGASGAFTQSGGSNIVGGSLYLGYSGASSSGSYNLSGGGWLSVGHAEYIGNSGSGSFLQSGGTNLITYDLYLGHNAGGTGAYTLSGGSLWVGGSEFIGDSGSGSFTQNGGTHTVGITADHGLYLGNSAGGSGSYTLGGGSLSVGGSEFIGYAASTAQPGGSGSFTQSGGNHSVGASLYLGELTGASGTYNLSGGSLSVVGSEYIGDSGSGYFTQSGGSNYVVGTLYLGHLSGASGTYYLSGGSLSAANESIGTGWGTNGNFIQGGGTNTVAGLLDVGANGQYVLGGSVTAPTFTVETGGSLLCVGSGTIQGNVTNSGLVSPGFSGALTIIGNYTQTATGTLEVAIFSTSRYSKLVVSGGSASLNGALSIQPVGYSLPSAGQTFTGILTTASGYTGTFSNIIGQNITPTLNWTVLYNPNSVDLQTSANFNNQAVLHLHPNLWQVGNMLNSVSSVTTGDLGVVLSAIESLPSNSAVANAFQQISADKVASLTTLGFAGSDFFNRGLANRINNFRYAGPGPISGLSGLGGLNLTGSRLDGLMLAYNSSSLAGLITGKKEAGPETPWGVYFYPDGSLGSQKSSTNQTGFDFAMAGFTAGADYQVRDNLLVGLASGYGYTGANLHGSGGNAQNNTWPINAYVAYLPQSFYAYGSLGYALNLFNLQRDIDFGGLSRAAKSSPIGNQFNAYGEAGYDLKAESLVVTPMVSLAYSSLWVNGFTESGAGALDLKVDPQQADSLQTGVGAKVSTVLQRNSVKVVPQYLRHLPARVLQQQPRHQRQPQPGEQHLCLPDRPVGEELRVGGRPRQHLSPEELLAPDRLQRRGGPRQIYCP